MKKITFWALSIAFLSITLVSCAKTTKGKIINEWKIVSSEQGNRTTNQNGDQFFESISMTGASVTNNTTYTPTTGTGYTSYLEGDVKTNTFSIKKDGTWIWNQELSYDEAGGSNMTKTFEQSGTWSFVGKTKGDDFKKNERVLFNILSNTTSSVHTINQSIVTSNSETITSITGENTLVFTVEGSKKKELQLKLEELKSFVNVSNISSYSKKLKMTLSAE